MKRKRRSFTLRSRVYTRYTRLEFESEMYSSHVDAHEFTGVQRSPCSITSHSDTQVRLGPQATRMHRWGLRNHLGRMVVGMMPVARRMGRKTNHDPSETAICLDAHQSLP